MRHPASAMQWRNETTHRGSYAHHRAAPHARHTTINNAANTAATIAPVESFVEAAAFVIGTVVVTAVATNIEQRPMRASSDIDLPS
jgi:hypothetical protein